MGKRIIILNVLMLVVLTANAQSTVTFEYSGQKSVHKFNAQGKEILGGTPFITFVLFPNAEWLLFTPTGEFDGSEAAFAQAKLNNGASSEPLSISSDKYTRGLASNALPQSIKNQFFERIKKLTNEVVANRVLPMPKLVVEPYGHTSTVMDMAFTSDGKFLVSVSLDKTIRVWDVESGENLKTFRGVTGDGTNGLLYRLAITPDDKMVAVGGFLDEDQGDYVGEIRFFELKTGKMVGTLNKAENSITSLAFSRDGSRFVIGSNDKMVRVIKKEYLEGLIKGVDYGDQVVVNAFKLNESILATALSPDGNRMVVSTYNYKAPVWFDIPRLVDQKDPKGYMDMNDHHDHEIPAIAFSPDGKFIITAEDSKAVVWDIDGNFVRDFAKIDITPRDGDIEFSKDGSRVIIGTQVYDFASGNQISRLIGFGNKVSAFSATNIGASAYENQIHLWNPDNGQLIRVLKPAFLPIEGIGFTGQGLKLAVSSKIPDDMIGKNTEFLPEEISYIFDFETLKIGEQSSEKAVSNLKFENNGIKLTRVPKTEQGENMATLNFGSIKINEKADLGIVNSFTILPTGNALITAGSRLISYDATGKKVQEFFGHSGMVSSVAISTDGNYMASLAADHSICLWNLTEKESSVAPVAILTIFDQGEWLCTTTDFYYAGSKRGGRYAGFQFNQGREKESKFYPFQQLDAYLNRPDLVLKSIGVNNPDLEKAFYAAYQKRLKKLGLNESTVAKDFSLPSVQIITQPHTTAGAKDTVEIFAIDNRYNLNRIMVSINEVPIHGLEGIALTQSPPKEITYKIPIDLNSGRNKVQVSVVNERGSESPREQVNIISTKPETVPNLFLVVIGVSDYLDNDFDLKYAAKDANDLVALLQTKKTPAVYGQVKVLNLVNQNATRDKILKAKDFLKQSKFNDEVILFVAGHGLLDDKMDWYFATHDLDFSNPATRGVKYEELEGLLTGIPARKKLMMMDACHSGEVDKAESSLVAAAPTTTSANVKSRGFKSKMVVQNSVGLKNSFEMMQQLFADLSNSSGAMVISSAGGAEFAFESPQWNNGVFTYSVLEGLKTGNADKNKDKTITVSELRDYVVAKVQSLTSGKQTPTSRKENLEFDFRVW